MYPRRNAMSRSNLAVVDAPVRVRLPEFDFVFLKEQMRRCGNFSDWSEARIDEAVLEYQRFLALNRAFPDEPIGINEDGDEIWHMHIINTRMYMDDCQKFFGYYLHHTPIATDAENAEAQQNSNRLYQREFGVTRLPVGRNTCVATGCMNNG
jgi:hypothetical protein